MKSVIRNKKMLNKSKSHESRCASLPESEKALCELGESGNYEKQLDQLTNPAYKSVEEIDNIAQKDKQAMDAESIKKLNEVKNNLISGETITDSNSNEPVSQPKQIDDQIVFEKIVDPDQAEVDKVPSESEMI